MKKVTNISKLALPDAIWCEFSEARLTSDRNGVLLLYCSHRSDHLSNYANEINTEWAERSAIPNEAHPTDAMGES